MKSTKAIRLELLAALSQLSQLRPEWRFGQTVANLATTAGRMDPGGVWDLEDEEALTAAKTLIERYAETPLGQWQGELKRPEQGEYEQREPLS